MEVLRQKTSGMGMRKTMTGKETAGYQRRQERLEQIRRKKDRRIAAVGPASGILSGPNTIEAVLDLARKG
jgi:hypothetical protein